MPTPSEHKTVQARILEYAEAIHLRQGYGGQVGWTIVSRERAEQRRGGIPAPLSGKVGGWKTPAPLSLSELRRTRPRSPEGYGGTGREFVERLRNRGKFFDHEEKWLRSVAKLIGGILERRVPEILSLAVREFPSSETS